MLVVKEGLIRFLNPEGVKYWYHLTNLPPFSHRDSFGAGLFAFNIFVYYQHVGFFP